MHDLGISAVTVEGAEKQTVNHCGQSLYYLCDIDEELLQTMTEQQINIAAQKQKALYCVMQLVGHVS